MSDARGAVGGAITARSHALHRGWATWFSAELVFATAGIIYEGLAFQRAIQMILAGVSGGWYALLSAFATLVFTLCYARAELYSITLVHRYFTHRSFDMVWWARAVVIALFHSTLEGLAILWGGWHLQHHAAPDTPPDIHSPVLYGWWHAQILWMWKTDFIRPPEIKHMKGFHRPWYSPLKVMEKYYWWIVALMGFALPVLVCGLWSDWVGGLLFGSFTRIVLVRNLTGLINSSAHTWGEAIEGAGSARNTAWKFFIWLVVGEPNHASHHNNPSYYRFGEYDPGADLIERMAKLRLASNLKGPDGLTYVGKAA